MNLGRAFLITCIAGIPLWYSYRTFSGRLQPDKQHSEKEDEVSRLKNELESVRAKLAEQNNRSRTSCLERVRTARAANEALAKERSLWNAEVQKATTTAVGAEIARNEDYVRAFREFSEEAPSGDVFVMPADIESAEKVCKDGKEPAWNELSFLDFRYFMGTDQDFYTARLKGLAESRKKIAGLVQLASGQTPPSLEAAIYRQYIVDAVEEYRTKRGEYVSHLRR